MSHETLATKIEEDVERPLREYSNKNRDMQSMPDIQSNLAGLAKNIDMAQKKVDKAKGKGAKGASNLSSAIAAAEEVNQQWESRAPFVYEQLQVADEGRLNHLRDVLTQLQTHEVDQVERCRQAAESCLNVLLNVETADEIKTFAAKMIGNRVPLSPVTSRRQNSQAESLSAVPAAATPPPVAAPLASLPHIQDDAASQRSERLETPAPAAPVQTPPGELITIEKTSCPVKIQTDILFSVPAPEPVPRHTPLGGLRRLGTVMNRRKSVIPPTVGSFDRKAEKKHRSPFASFKRSDSSREMQIPESPPSTADRPGTSMTEESSLRNPSVSHNHNGADTITPAPIPEHEPLATNGTWAEAQAGITSNGTPQVRSLLAVSPTTLTQFIDHSHRPMLIRKASLSGLQLLMRSLVLKEKQQGMGFYSISNVL